MYHISDLKKFRRCPRLFQQDVLYPRNNTHESYVRIDEEVTLLAAQKLHIPLEQAFLGARGDDPALAMSALTNHEWLIKARFAYDRLRIKIPFLHHTAAGWDLYFLFIGLFPRSDDVFFYSANVWVLQKLGLSVDHIFILHLNAAYIRGNELDPEELFVISDSFYNVKGNPTVLVDAAVREGVHDLIPLMDDMDRCLLAEVKPKRTAFCTGRQKCERFDQCFPDAENYPDNSILTLIASGSRYAMRQQGIFYLKDADVDLLEGTRMQYAQVMADRNGGLFVDRNALKTWLKRIHYPVACLDFEWERFAVPPYRGMRPYDVLPFEYSLHILEKDGSMRHTIFLSTRDDRLDMVQALLRDVPRRGTVLAYNAEGAEKKRIAEFAQVFPKYAQGLRVINERMEDLQLPFLSGTVYDVRMNGSWSLKAIMGMMDDPGYQSIDIHEGMDAVFAWRHLDRQDPAVDEEKIREELVAYCGMDSYAMTVVLRWLENL